MSDQRRVMAISLCFIALSGWDARAAMRVPPSLSNPFYLRSDTRLHAKLSIHEKQPKLSKILTHLATATKVKLSMSDELRDHDPDFGHVQMNDARAFSFMELIAERQLEGGRWERTETGYRLTGRSTVPRAPAPALAWSLLGEATARLKDALDDRDFTVSEAVQLAARMGMLGTNQLAQAAWMQTAHSATFVATFIEKLAEYAVDKVQDELEKIGLVAQFIPGVGQIIGAVASGLNAAIYLARGKYVEAGFSVFAMIPFGSILAKPASAASRLGALALRQAGRGLVAVARFVHLPALAQAARRLACPVLRVITLGRMGCFVAGTLVVVGEEWVAVVLPVAHELAQFVPAALPAEEDAPEWDGLCLVLLVGAVGLTLGGWLLLKRRRSAEELADDEVWLDGEDWLGGKDADWEAMLAELARGRLGLREGGVGA